MIKSFLNIENSGKDVEETSKHIDIALSQYKGIPELKVSKMIFVLCSPLDMTWS